MAFLLEEWYFKVGEDFYQKVSETLNLLSRQPELGIRISGTVNSFSFPVSYYRLVYYFDDETIIITDLVDMRSGEATIK